MSKFEEVKDNLQSTVNRLPFEKLTEISTELGEAATALSNATTGTKTEVGKEFQAALQEIPDIFYKLKAVEGILGELAVKMGGAISAQTAGTTQYSFSTEVDPKIRFDAISHLEEMGYAYPALLAEKEENKTLKDEATISAVTDTTNSYFEERFGVSLGDRAPSVDNIHIVKEEVVGELKRKTNPPTTTGLSSEKVTAFINGKDVILPKDVHPNTVQHEALHRRAHRRISITSSDNQLNLTIDSVGIADGTTEDFSLISEAVTEKTNQEIIKQTWAQHPHLKNVEPQAAGYGPLIPYFDGVCQEIAEKSGQTADEVFKSFQRAEYLGDPSIFTTMENVLGVEKVIQLARLSFNDGGPLEWNID